MYITEEKNKLTLTGLASGRSYSFGSYGRDAGFCCPTVTVPCTIQGSYKAYIVFEDVFSTYQSTRNSKDRLNHTEFDKRKNYVQYRREQKEQVTHIHNNLYKLIEKLKLFKHKKQVKI